MLSGYGVCPRRVMKVFANLGPGPESHRQDEALANFYLRE
jgi:hypothetical protein